MPRGIIVPLYVKQLIVSKYQSGIKQATISKQLNLNRSVKLIHTIRRRLRDSSLPARKPSNKPSYRRKIGPPDFSLHMII